MKRLFWLIVPLLTFSSCTRSSEHLARVDDKKGTPDYFEKKLKCAALLEKTKKRLEAETEESMRFAYANRNQGYTGSYCTEICYSKKHNTCVAFIDDSQYGSFRSGRKKEGETYRAVDMLTDALIDSVYQQYDKSGKRVPSAAGEPSFYSERTRIKNSVECAE